jgi:hypothetical protein
MAAESGRFTRTVSEFGSGRPPKRRAWVVLNAAIECQAREGEVLVEEGKSDQGGDWAENSEDKERNRTWSVLGADVYEYWLD